MAAVTEFELIRRYFTGLGGKSPGQVLGVGDDCAILAPPPGRHLAITTDTLVAGVHFPTDCDPSLLARRALRVNLSDLAAMGADPLGIQLALTLPEARPSWLEAFSEGLARDCALFACPLLGGDTTRGPLSVTITALGTLPAGSALTRGGASAGDRLYVTGTLGDARAALAVMDDRGIGGGVLGDRYWLPEPRLAAGRLLRGLASAALDISDGLVQDAGHIAAASGLGCRVETWRLPLSTALLERFPAATAQQWALGGGDDYELCFTVPPQRAAEVEATLTAAGQPFACIGEMEIGNGVRCVDADGRPVAVERGGYAHF